MQNNFFDRVRHGGSPGAIKPSIPGKVVPSCGGIPNTLLSPVIIDSSHFNTSSNNTNTNTVNGNNNTNTNGNGCSSSKSI